MQRKAPTPKQMTDRRSKLATRYGITLEEYEDIKKAQNGVCPICRRAKGLSKNLAVDHDHQVWDGKVSVATREQRRDSVRGLLCGRCNNRVGWYEQNRDKVVEYLTNPPAKRVL